MKKTISWHKQQMEKHREAALKIAEKKLIAMAVGVMKKHKNCKSFMICMGTWCFFTTDSWGQFNHTIGPKYIDPIRNFIAKWDEDLYLTGNPMTIYPNGKIIRDW